MQCRKTLITGGTWVIACLHETIFYSMKRLHDIDRAKGLAIFLVVLGHSVLVGDDVNGGLYGEMFPLKEAMPDGDDYLNRSPLEIPGRDIEGLTSFYRVYAEVCEWMQPNSGLAVFPESNNSPLESGVNLNNLLAV